MKWIKKCWEWIIMLTWSIWLASNAVPGNKMTGLDTWPASTHNIFGYSSSPKSAISRARSDHGFQMTAEKYNWWNCCFLFSHDWFDLIRKICSLALILISRYLYLENCIFVNAFYDPIQHLWLCALAVCADRHDQSIH